MLRQRLITAIILLPLVLAGIFYLPPFAFQWLCAAVILFAAWEWTLLMGLKKALHRIGFLILLLALMFVEEHMQARAIFTVAIFWWVLALFWITQYPQHTKLWSNKFILTILGVEVLLPCWLGMVLIREQHSSLALLFLFMIVWAADSGGYFVGRAIGKHKLLPKVSPGKTIEGVIGGVVTTLIMASVFIYIFAIPQSQWGYWLALVLVTVLISVEGDLLISMLKRKQGLKDTGNILPGHGGLLDRIDSLTAAAPLFVLGLDVLHFSLR